MNDINFDKKNSKGFFIKFLKIEIYIYIHLNIIYIYKPIINAMLAYALARRNIKINQLNDINSEDKNTYIQTSNNLFVRIYYKIKDIFN